MNTDQHRILIVENQEFQFLKIVEGFMSFKPEDGKKYSVNWYPKQANFISFIDHVRVWVTKGYLFNDNYRTQALNHILSTIVDEEIELILMDHILGGAYDAYTGIDLARAINEARKEGNLPVLPVIFLSKSEHTGEKRQADYIKYETEFPVTSTWIHKGYFGEEVLRRDYFHKHVVSAVSAYRVLSQEQEFLRKFDKVLALTFPKATEEVVFELKRIRKNVAYGRMSLSFREMILSVCVTCDFGRIDKKTLANEK